MLDIYRSVYLFSSLGAPNNSLSSCGSDNLTAEYLRNYLIPSALLNQSIFSPLQSEPWEKDEYIVERLSSKKQTTKKSFSAK